MHQKIVTDFNNYYPNERKRLLTYWNNAVNKIQGNKMRSMGVKSGVSDLIWLADNGRTIWIELKHDTNTQDPEQIKFQDQCNSIGHVYIICRSYTEFWGIIGFKQPI